LQMMQKRGSARVLSEWLHWQFSSQEKVRGRKCSLAGASLVRTRLFLYLHSTRGYMLLRNLKVHHWTELWTSSAQFSSEPVSLSRKF
jgi:hypothetical protein